MFLVAEVAFSGAALADSATLFWGFGLSGLRSTGVGTGLGGGVRRMESGAVDGSSLSRWLNALCW